MMYIRYMQCIYDIKFGMLQVRKNEIALRKCSGSSAQLRTLEEHWSPGRLRDVTITTVNLNRKLGSLMRTNVFREEVIVDHNKL